MRLTRGAHSTFKAGTCAMELAAHLAGLPHSDSPACTSPTIAAYVRVLNDLMDDETRNTLLLPLIPDLLGTAGADEQRLAYMCADRAVRVFAPIALRAAGREEHAASLEALPPIVDDETADDATDATAAYAPGAPAASAASDASAWAAAAYASDAAAAAAAAADAARSGAWPEAIQLLKDLIHDRSK